MNVQSIHEAETRTRVEGSAYVRGCLLFDSFLEKILQLATLNHSSLKAAKSIDLDLKKILPSSEF